MFERIHKPRRPVTVHLDGAAIEAEEGEPLAVSLIAASAIGLARSPKLHRPRGPSCLRGDCDGCLARVDDVPNVMLCLRRAKGGEAISTQNVLGSRDLDLLRITDWFFPKGIDHHHLMAGIPGVSDVMQSFARKLAGIGRLPTEIAEVEPARRIACDVLVIGAGLAGVVAASELAARGLDVHLVDDNAAVGGSARAAGGLATTLLSEHPLDRVSLHLSSTAAGIYEGGAPIEAIVATPEGARVVTPKATVLATGAHDGALAVPNNDLPGVLSARALCLLHHFGVRPTEQVAIIGEGFWAERLSSVLGDRVAFRWTAAELAEIEGSSRVKGVRSAGGARQKVGVVALALPGAPAFELGESMGADVGHTPAGFRLVTGAHGRIGASAWAVGECTGVPFDPEPIARAAKACASAVAGSLG